jgi:hypothetical protein
MSDLMAKYRAMKAAEKPSQDPMHMSKADQWLWTEATQRIRIALEALEKEMVAKHGPPSLPRARAPS